MKYPRAHVLLLYCLVVCGCSHYRDRPMSFYYWRTGFHLDTTEKQALADNAVRLLYVRYFDVDIPAGQSQPVPVSPVRLDSTVRHYGVIPVVYIRNRVFERVDSAAVSTLAGNVFTLVAQISRSQSLHPDEIQFDCDWTEKTKDNYFHFLRQYRAISGQPLAATIRLHQVKYAQRTGIPPADHGILMYYNMGEINAGSQNSIYDKAVAARYASYIRFYPLALDVALPIFAWSLKIQGGRVVQLLDKINFTQFENDSNFNPVKKDWFIARHACFKGGYYFREKDLVKTERVPPEALLEIAGQLNRFSNHKLRSIIFYDLDSINLHLYDKAIFKKVLDTID